jgi:hypothetical protein
LRCYAVLASVSRCYPPLKGRLVTCYSPGRHFTHGLLHFLVRLACVRHAASVDSEPGSNSRLKPDACRRVVGRLPSPHIRSQLAKADSGFNSAGWRHRSASAFSSCEEEEKFTVVYLVRSFRTYARIRSLTTGTFNRVVKDRIAFRLSGAPSVLDGLAYLGEPKSESGCPRNLTNIQCGEKSCNRSIPQYFHGFSTSGRLGFETRAGERTHQKADQVKAGSSPDSLPDSE